MTILIKGMKKPDHCLQCKIFRTEEDKGDICPLLSDDENYKYDSWEKMLEHCPIVEMPKSHGRLIDADKYLNKVKYEAEGMSDDYGDVFINYTDWVLGKEPTVIEAEEKTNG